MKFKELLLALNLLLVLAVPGMAEVQGRPLQGGTRIQVVWSREGSGRVGQVPALSFDDEPNTFYQVEVFTLGAPARMGITDLGGRLRAKNDHTRSAGYHQGRRLFVSSFAYNPQYRGEYRLRVAGNRGQVYGYRVTKYRVLPKPANTGLTVNRSRQQMRREATGGSGGGQVAPTSIYGI
ncbi:MAG: hypothetical protein KC910_27135 [Candidatus Eremiobacteraeota bacterium]|nr:hypothetical protein [Candidatus Eremiobacteraeota bacterium]